MFTLDQILDLVGTLDDASGDDTPRERFRRHLRGSVTTIGPVRDYVEACVRNKGTQYDHALQDLVNHTASLIGFEVAYGRYKGVTNDIGHDGLWRWKDFVIVVEVKTTDAFAIQTSAVVGYVDKLISAGQIPDWDHAMGLYVFGRTDSELKQVANSIVAEKRTHQLRIATVDSILSLAELIQESNITPDEAVALLRPAGVFVGDTVQLLARIAAKSTETPSTASAGIPEITAVRPVIAPVVTNTPPPTKKSHAAPAPAKRMYLMTPVSDDPQVTAKDTIHGLLSSGWYVFGDRTAGRKQLKPGDRLCFYESGFGVVAEAEVASAPEQKPPPIKDNVKNLDKFPWSFRIKTPRFFFDKPVVIDADLRAKLEAFVGRDPAQPWAWFVQGTHPVSEHDFLVLTGQAQSSSS
jgi:hypothetical protein